MALDIFEYAQRGKVFHAANTAGATLSALSTTATGFILNNPWGSGKNVAILRIQWAPSTAPAGAAIVGLAMSPAISETAVTHTTPLVVRSATLHGNADGSIAKVDTSATTVGTPVFVRFLSSVVAASSITPYCVDDRVDGALILVPGTSVQMAYVTTAAVGCTSMTWLEYTA